MPHTPATQITILKKDGEGPVGPMAQDRAEAYLTPVLNDANRLANLKQSLNDITSGNGRPPANTRSATRRSGTPPPATCRRA